MTLIDEPASHSSPKDHVHKTKWVLAKELTDLLSPVAQLQVAQDGEPRAVCGATENAIGFWIGDPHANKVDWRKALVSCAGE